MPLATADALDGVYDVCVVGAGPAGLACAFDCQEAGLKTLLLEAGGATPKPGEPDLIAADILDPDWHDPVDIVSAAAVGGSSHWWGGRCVPFDPVDFRFWPLRYEDMLPWWEKAADFLGARAVSESPPPTAFAKLTRFDAVRDECWGPVLNMERRWRARIRAAQSPILVAGARVVGLRHNGGRIAQIEVRIGDELRRVRAGHVVLACGGLGTLRLLLLLQRDDPALFGGPEGPLGRGYMGHLTGSIAALRFAQPSDAQAFFTRPVGQGVHARRRLRPRPETVLAENIVNIAFWLDNAAASDPAHGDAAASAKYLAARALRLGRGEGELAAHVRNVARAPVSAAAGLARAATLLTYASLTGRHPRAGKLTPCAPDAWRLHYHAEQTREDSNRVSLSERRDSVGLPKLVIDFRMRPVDFEGVLRAHRLFDADLAEAGAGALVWSGDEAALLARIAAAARDGYHQLGGARMSRDAREGAVTPDCRAHAVENLWIAAGCTFPSSGQANPTLTVVALARRLAAKLVSQARVGASAKDFAAL